MVHKRPIRRKNLDNECDMVDGVGIGTLTRVSVLIIITPLFVDFPSVVLGVTSVTRVSKVDILLLLP